MTERKTCGPNGDYILEYIQQRDRADDAELRLREALARLALREALIETMERSGAECAARCEQLEAAMLRDEGTA